MWLLVVLLCASPLISVALLGFVGWRISRRHERIVDAAIRRVEQGCAYDRPMRDAFKQPEERR